MNNHNISQYIEKIDSYLSEIKTRLETITEFKKVIIYTETNYAQIFDLLPQGSMPIAVITYGGSNYSNNPRRSAMVSILAITKNLGSVTSAGVTAQNFIDKIIEKLDHEVLINQAVGYVIADKPVDFADMGISCYEITLRIDDH